MKKTLHISGMTCQHCVMAVTRALEECDGVSAVSVDLDNGLAVVSGTDMKEEDLHAAVDDAGYEVTAID